MGGLLVNLSLLQVSQLISKGRDANILSVQLLIEVIDLIRVVRLQCLKFLAVLRLQLIDL